MAEVVGVAVGSSAEMGEVVRVCLAIEGSQRAVKNESLLAGTDDVGTAWVNIQCEPRVGIVTVFHVEAIVIHQA